MTPSNDCGSLNSTVTYLFKFVLRSGDASRGWGNMEWELRYQTDEVEELTLFKRGHWPADVGGTANSPAKVFEFICLPDAYYRMAVVDQDVTIPGATWTIEVCKA